MSPKKFDKARRKYTHTLCKLVRGRQKLRPLIAKLDGIDSEVTAKSTKAQWLLWTLNVPRPQKL